MTQTNENEVQLNNLPEFLTVSQSERDTRENNSKDLFAEEDSKFTQKTKLGSVGYVGK